MKQFGNGPFVLYIMALTDVTETLDEELGITIPKETWSTWEQVGKPEPTLEAHLPKMAEISSKAIADQAHIRLKVLDDIGRERYRVNMGS